MFNKYKGKGLTGLANLGNTCYINSGIQILSHCYEFQEKLNSIDQELEDNVDVTFLKEYIDLRNIMWKSNCKIAPSRFLKIIHLISEKKDRPLFTGYSQQDLPEFLLFIIDCFHNSIKKKMKVEINGVVKNEKDKINNECYKVLKHTYENEYSIIYDLFYGMYVTNIYNLKGKKVSFRPDPFLTLDLPIPEYNNNKDISIYDCLDLFCNDELLDGENMWLDETQNKKIEVKKKIVFWKLPDILIVVLKRFHFVKKTNQNKKKYMLIDVPIKELDLTKYMIHKTKNVYELFGVCNHMGKGSDSGHYTSNVLNANGKWYNFNDTFVKEISNSKIVTPNGYCFFFRKKT
jgi:ubiquitin C-terminal hydrolase